MDAQISKLTVTVDHLQQAVLELKGDVRALREDVMRIRTTDFRLMFGAILSITLGLAALMARGFHWL